MDTCGHWRERAVLEGWVYQTEYSAALAGGVLLQMFHHLLLF